MGHGNRSREGVPEMPKMPATLLVLVEMTEHLTMHIPENLSVFPRCPNNACFQPVLPVYSSHVQPQLLKGLRFA